MSKIRIKKNEPLAFKRSPDEMRALGSLIKAADYGTLVLPIVPGRPYHIEVEGLYDHFCSQFSETGVTPSGLREFIVEARDSEKYVYMKEKDSYDIFSQPPIPISVPLTWPINQIMPGVLAVMGDTAAGKSEYIAAEMEPTVTIRYGEPLEAFDLKDGYIHPSYSDVESFLALLLYTAAGHTVALDGLRPLLFDLRGAAMSGGLVARVYNVVTSLSNCLAAAAGVGVITLNPMKADDADLVSIYRLLAASISGVVHVHKTHTDENGGKTFDASVTYRDQTGRFFGDRIDDVERLIEDKTKDIDCPAPGKNVRQPLFPDEIRKMEEDRPMGTSLDGVYTGDLSDEDNTTPRRSFSYTAFKPAKEEQE